MNYKKLYDHMQGAKWFDYVDEALDALINYDVEYGELDIFDYETIEEIAKQEMEKGGLLRLYHFMGDCILTDDYYTLDGYGNLKNLTKDIISDKLQEIIEREAERER